MTRQHSESTSVEAKLKTSDSMTIPAGFDLNAVLPGLLIARMK